MHNTNSPFHHNTIAPKQSFSASWSKDPKIDFVDFVSKKMNHELKQQRLSFKDMYSKHLVLLLVKAMMKRMQKVCPW